MTASSLLRWLPALVGLLILAVALIFDPSPTSAVGIVALAAAVGVLSTVMVRRRSAGRS